MAKQLYPLIEPYRTSYLPECDGHKVYYEEVGNPQGIPILFIHGGPGSGCDPFHRCFFNASRFRIILMDQRGSGRSHPYADLRHNTTDKLIFDCERLREELGIAKWHLFGGSWGSTLALAYAIAHPQRVLSLTLRGIFLGREKDINWFYKEGGASQVYPEEWERFLEPLNHKERRDPLLAYFHKLQLTDATQVTQAALAWTRWEGIALRLSFNEETFHAFVNEKRCLALARIESHYFVNHCFFKENYLIENASKIQDIPCTIVHGRYDMICPFDNAFTLKKALPKATLIAVQEAGHSATEVGILEALLTATDQL